MKQNVYRAICSAILIALFLGIGLIEHTQVHAEAALYPPAGTVLVSGSQWAGSYASKGDLNVYSNGYSGNPNCSGGNGSYGCRWQCVELAQRWAAIGLGEPYKIWPNVRIAPDMWSEGPKLPVPFQQHLNGGGGQPQFGDLLIFAGNPGHVAIVKDVQNGYVDIVEQNWSSNGQASLPITNGTIPPRSRMSIIGWLRSVNSPPPMPPMVKTASAVPSLLHHPADFSLHAGTQVAEYNSTTNSFSYQGTWVQPVGAIDWAAAGDFNGDGVADFAIHANNAIYVYLSTKTSFVFQGSWVSPVGAFDWGGVGDFNGDGKADFALHANNTIYTYLSTGNSFAFQGPWVSPVGAFDWGGVGDFNGDGKADFAIHANNAIYTYLSTGSSFAFQGVWVQPVGAFDWGGIGDVNGDGKADFVLHNSGAIYTYLSTGTSFAFQGVWVQPVGAFDSGWLADFNGS